MERKSKEFEHAYTMWARAKKEYRLCDDDREPDFNLFGLSAWEASQIKALVDHELRRTA